MNRPLPAWFLPWGDLLFSARIFAGAILALFIAFTLDLPRPYWAMATVYIVAQPLSGALRSKAVYRVCGTVLGAAVTVGLVPNLINAPELLALAMSLWIGLCLYLSLIDRTPRSYVFMLAGYSAALIGFPSVTDPGAIFDVALARVEEITLGVVCATLAGSVVFHRPIGPILSAHIDAWLRDAERSTLDALAGRRDDDETLADRRRLAADAVELQMLATQLAFDTSPLRRTTRWVRLLHQRMVMLLPILSSIADRMAALRQSGAEFVSPHQADLAALSDWIRDGQSAPREISVKFRSAISQNRSVACKLTDWNAILLTSLLTHLSELVKVTQDCRDLRRHIAATCEDLPPRRILLRASTGANLHRDHGMALLSGLAAALSVLLGCLVWVASAWPDGGLAGQMAAVACCLFAAQDDPVPAIVNFTRAAATGLVIAGIYLFAVLPAIEGFPLLVLVLAPTFLTIGLLVTNPGWAGLAAPVAVIGATLMSLQDRYTANFSAFLNSGLSVLIGVSLAGIVTALVRSVGAEWSAHRLLRAGWADLAGVTARPRTADRTVFAGRMLDRLGMLTPRLAAVAPGADIAAADTLTDLQIGLDILDLQHLRPALPTLVERAVAEMLDELVRHFSDRSTRHTNQAPPSRLLLVIDRALAEAAISSPARTTQRLLGALAGIRRGLFPGAPPYAPAPATGWQAAA